MGWPDVGAGRLEGGTDGGKNTVHVLVGNTSGTEDVAVGEELGSKISDGELRKNDLCAGVGESLELLEDDLPLGVDDSLVVLYFMSVSS